MNNLIKILISLFVAHSLNADQGKLISINPVLTYATGNGIVDMSTEANNLYTVNNSFSYKYDINGTLLKQLDLTSNVKKVVATTNYIYILKDTSLVIYNTDLNVSEGIYASTKNLNALDISDDENYIFIGTTTGVSVIDVSNVNAPSSIAFLDTTNAHDLKVRGDNLYVADDWSGLKVLDISNPATLSVSSSVSGTYYKLALENDYLYTLGTTGLSAFDITSPVAPLYRSSINTYNAGTIMNIDSSTNFYVQDMYAYIGGNVNYIFDVSNKSVMKDTAPINITALSILGNGTSIFISTGGATYKDTPTSDYDDNASAATNQVEKTVVNLSSDEGVFGELSNATDVDFIKLNLQNGRFNAIITGLSDLNVSLYDTNDTTQVPIDSVRSNPTTSKTLEMNIGVTSGIHYLKVQSPGGTIGEYKIVADFTSDDWTDSKTSANLINLGESIDGNILSGDDKDYFRVDFSSKGTLYFTSSHEDIIDIEIENSYDATIITGTGSLSVERSYDIPSAGVYFIKVKARSADVQNQDYSFRVDFSKNDALDKEDDSQFAFKQIDTHEPTSTDFDLIKGEGPYLYIFNRQDSTLYKKNKTDYTDVGSYNTQSGISDYQIVGDYIYILSSNQLSILYKNMSLRSSIATQTSSTRKVMVNGDYAYISSYDSSSIEVIDISNKDALSFMQNVNTNFNVNDFDIKASFDDDTATLKTYLYIATNSGIRIYDFLYTEDENGVVSLTSTLVQKYRDYESFNKIVISNPYAYVSGDSGFSILYIKRPTSAPKLKGTLSIYSIYSILLNQDFVYLITNNDFSSNEYYLKVIDIKDQTSPTQVDIGSFSAKGIFVEDGLGYAMTYSVLISKTDVNKLAKYDMAKDYSDVKGKASNLDFDNKNYGVISEYRANEIDMFYINVTNSLSINFSASGDINTTYEIFNYNEDTPVHNFDALSTETNSSVDLSAGEYYLKVTSTDLTTTGSYEFSAVKVEDDYSDNFVGSVFIDLGVSYDANITTNDKDVVKVVIDERGEFTFITDINISAKLYYDDTTTLIATDINSTISVELNPGTYFIQLESKVGFSGEYSFNATLAGNGELAMPDGFDDIRNFNATHILYGPRYIYIIDKSNQLAIYNHLLQKVEEGAIDPYGDNLNNDYNQYCGKALYNNNMIYLNSEVLDYSTGQYTCGHGFRALEIESDGGGDGEFYHNIFPNNMYLDYITSTTSNTLMVEDVTIVGIDGYESEEYAYIYSDLNDAIYKVKTSSDLYQSLKPYGEFSTNAAVTIDDIDFIQNDGDIDFIAISNVLSIYLSNPNYILKDANGDTIDNTPKILASNSFTFATGDISDIYLDKDLQKLYLLSKGSTLVSIVDYSSGVGSATKVDIDLGMEANSMYIKDGAIYFSFSSYGVKSYPYPLLATSTAILDIENIGVDISKPFTYDGTTINYLSSGDPQVFYLSDSFVDGTTSGTYSVITDVKEGEGGFEGCFIATAAYGSYFQSNVKVLRDFRDDYLLQNELGRIFVDFYYRHSPSIASDIATSEVAKSVVRVILTPLVYMIKYPLVFLAFMILLIGGLIIRTSLGSPKVVAS